MKYGLRIAAWSARLSPQRPRHVLVSAFIIVSLVLASWYSATEQHSLLLASTAQPRVVRISAERFAFTPSEVTVAPGTAIEFHLKSDDTAHGFRILGQSVDVTIPKRGRGEATVTFTPPEPGTYIFECSRMCGAGHSFMRGVIRVRAEAGE
jgi:cytochrome c oxidase subunit 2